MGYDGKILQKARIRFEADKQRREDQFAGRKSRVYQEIPRLREIETELRGTMSKLIANAINSENDPLPAIHTLRDENMSLQQERRALLRAHGYPQDYLEDKPKCDRCNDSGFCGGGVCTCLQNYYAQEQIKELSKLLDIGGQTFEDFDLEWYSPVRHDDLPHSPRETAERNKKICKDFADSFGKQQRNLLLFGTPGLGKTFLSASIARVVSEDGFSVVYDTASHIFSQFEEVKFSYDSPEKADKEVNRYLNCDLLIVDDLGTEMTTSFVQSMLYQIVNSRLLTGKCTVINTNLEPEEIGRRYSPQVLSRLEGEYELLPFVGEDIRKLKRQRGL